MIKALVHKFKNLNVEVKKVMIKGFNFSFKFCLFSALILILYMINKIPILFDIGLILFKASIMIFVDFIIMGIGFDTIEQI